MTNKERKSAKTIKLANRKHHMVDYSGVVDVTSLSYIGTCVPDPDTPKQTQYAKRCGVIARRQVKKTVFRMPPPTKECQRILMNMDKFPWVVGWACTCGGKRCRSA
jgi:hypothetical protein